MFLFGKENKEIHTAPFLVKTIEEDENAVRFIIAFPLQGEKGTNINETGVQELNKLISESTPIYQDDNNLYEILFEDYIFHMTRNESYTCKDDYEIQNGKYFILFDKSRLLDFLPQIVELEMVKAYYSDEWKHYGIYCQNHIIDIVAIGEPKIKKLK